MTDKELIDWIYDRLIELNPNNYNHDDLIYANDAVVDVLLTIKERKENS